MTGHIWAIIPKKTSNRQSNYQSVAVQLNITDIGKSPNYEDPFFPSLAELTIFYQRILALQSTRKTESPLAVAGLTNVFQSFSSPFSEWTNDIIEACIPFRGLLPRGYRCVRWLHTRQQLTVSPETINVILPPSGYVVPTHDGLYNPESGVPFATEADLEQAMKSWRKNGYDQDFVNIYISAFKRNDLSNPPYAVMRFADILHGPFAMRQQPHVGLRGVGRRQVRYLEPSDYSYC